MLYICVYNHSVDMVQAEQQGHNNNGFFVSVDGFNPIITADK
jgi:hypothetical protein